MQKSFWLRDIQIGHANEVKGYWDLIEEFDRMAVLSHQ